MKIQFGENSQMALKNLRENKLRSVLTIVGVVIGVTVMILVASILVGLDADLHGFLDDYGPDTLFIFKFSPGIHIGRLSAEERARKPLALDDALAMRDLPAVKSVVAELYPRFTENGPGPIKSARYKGHEISNLDYGGTWPSYQEVYNAQLSEGRFFTEVEDEHRADVVVIGSDLNDTFFKNEDALGKTILVDKIPYTVIGVLQKRKGQFFKDQSADRVCKVPMRTYQKHHPGDDEVFIGALPQPGMKSAAADQITELLRRRRKVPPDKPDNFGISSPEEIANQFLKITGALALITFTISTIGLLVGGVGVMNIMLMSVTERTREIGVRKAIGARRRDIIWQFLTEAITLTGLGGIIGVIIGFALAMLIRLVFTELPTSVPAWAVITGVVVSMSVGLFFGMYPAVKASRLDPVEALRYE
jgi:putative ABC transport system permease protein